MARARSLWALLVLATLLAGCGANPYGVRETNYVAPASPGPDETLVYVFREDSSFAAARKFAIIDNDTVMAVLTPGTFSHFRVPSSEHEIVAYMAPSPIMHYRVTPTPGKTVYLLCRVGYASGMFIEPIDAQRARELMSQYRYTEIEQKGEKAKMNYKEYYDRLYSK
jgi:hypothetical protein